MEEVAKKKNTFYYVGLVCGVLSVLLCLVTLGLSVSDSYFSIYILSAALVLLGINRIGLHLNNFKQNALVHVFLTVFIFVLAVLVSLTSISLYFLITSMFCYSLTIVVNCLLAIKKDKSIQSIIFNSLCMVLSFLFSFVFFFPAIFEKHASSVSNYNFIILCYSTMIIISSLRNVLAPYTKKLKLHTISNILKKSLVNEIILGLLILIFLFSIYFTLVEPNINSYVDALWYSFSVITTIGFGDVLVTTTLGRILSVILGISGIAVVAVFTSFIVNFYNEMNKKREERTLKKLIKETKELEKLEEEELEERKKEEKE